MIQLIRVYKDGRVIHAETYDHDEYPPPLPEHLRCRCMPLAIWQKRMKELRHEFPHAKVTVDSIYLSREDA